MGDIAVSTLIQQIENHIQANRASQALALCGHILYYFPKHLETYSLMGQVLSLQGNYEGALDVYRRVLSADPENAGAYAGIAHIFDFRHNLQEAIWHLERAFELTPTQPNIRKELLRLYAQYETAPRDKLKLTRGALARLYVQEGLYDQAINEFREIGSTSLSRYDIRTALAETLFRAGRTRDAADVATSLLDALPYCLKANLILGTAWHESEIAESQKYLERAVALDPSNQVAQKMLGARSPLRLATVMVPEYVEGKPPTPRAAEKPAPQTEPPIYVPVEEGETLSIFEAPESSVQAPAPTVETTESPSAPEIETQPTESMKVVEEPLAHEPLPPATEIQAPATKEVESEPAAEIKMPQEPAAETDKTIPPSETKTTELPVVEEAEGTRSTEAESSQEFVDEATFESRAATSADFTEIQETESTAESELPPWLRSDAVLPTESLAAESDLGEATPPPEWLLELKRNFSDESEEVTGAPAEQLPTPGFLGAVPSHELSSEPRGEAQTRAEDEPIPDWLTAATEVPEEKIAEAPPAWLTEAMPSIAEAPAAMEPNLAGEASVPSVSEEPAAITEEAVIPPAEEAPVASEPAPAAQETLEPTKETPPTERAPTTFESAPVVQEIPEPTAETIPTEQAPMASEPAPAAQETSELTKQTAPMEQIHPPTESAPRIEETPAPAQPRIPKWVEVLSRRESVQEKTEARFEPAPPAAEAAQTEAPAQAEPAAPQPETPTARPEPPPVFHRTPPKKIEVPRTPAPTAAEISEPEPAKAIETFAPPTAEAEPESVRAPAQPRVKRQPKYFSRLAQAREHRNADRIPDALAEYEFVIQKAPRLVNEVILDLEALVATGDAPLDAHRLLGDAYTHAGRLNDALERYRYVKRVAESST